MYKDVYKEMQHYEHSIWDAVENIYPKETQEKTYILAIETLLGTIKSRKDLSQEIIKEIFAASQTSLLTLSEINDKRLLEKGLNVCKVFKALCERDCFNDYLSQKLLNILQYQLDEMILYVEELLELFVDVEKKQEKLYQLSNCLKKKLFTAGGNLRMLK